MIEERNLFLKTYSEQFPRDTILGYMEQMEQLFFNLKTESSAEFVILNKQLKKGNHSFKNIQATNDLINNLLNGSSLLNTTNYTNQSKLQLDATNTIEHYLIKLNEKQIELANHFEILFTQSQLLLEQFSQEENANNTKEAIKKLLVIEKLKTHWLNALEDLSSKTENCINEVGITNKELLDTKQVPSNKIKVGNLVSKLNNKTNIYSSQLNDIVNKIQYFDIISQKLEHIQQTQLDLSTNLVSSQTELELAQWVAKTKLINDIQLAQLNQVQKDYSSSKGNINICNLNINKIKVDIQNLYADFAIILSEVVKNYDEIINTPKEAIKTLSTHLQYYCDASEWDLLTQMESYLFQLIHAFEKNRNTKLKDEIMLCYNETEHITKLLHDIKALNKNIKLELILFRNSSLIPKELEGTQKAINKITKNAMDQDLTFFEEISSGNKDHKNQNYFKYYITQIDTLLQEINSNLNYKTLISHIDIDSSQLNNIEKLYTMDSEREIHNKLVKNSKIKINTQAIINTVDESGLELF